MQLLVTPSVPSLAASRRLSGGGDRLVVAVQPTPSAQRPDEVTLLVTGQVEGYPLRTRSACSVIRGGRYWQWVPIGHGGMAAVLLVMRL